MTNVWIFNYIAAREFVPPDGPAIAIRIFDPWETRPEGNSDQQLAQSPHWVAKIKAVFEDLDPRRYELAGAHDVAARIWEQNPFVFKEEQAEQLVKEFSQALLKYGPITTLMVHCNAGLSRSPATARAISEIFQLEPVWKPTRDTMMHDGHVGNLHVYETLKRVAGVSL